MSVLMQDFIFTNLFLEMMCDLNDNGTRNLILRGNELIKKVGKRVENGDIPRLVSFLKKHPNIVTLELPYNEIGDCGVQAIMNYIVSHVGVRHLNLVGNNIGPEGIKHIVGSGEKLPLYTLRLSCNKFGNEGGIILSQLLYMKIPLKELDLMDTHQSMTSLSYLMTGLMWNRGGADTLSYIDLGKPQGQFFHTMCSTHAAEFVGQIFRFNKGLKELHLQQYRFKCQDIEIMLDGLMTNTTLQCLDLNNNHIGDDGVLYLCKYLKTGPPLQCLMIGSNGIKDLGARSLSFALPYSCVRVLDITKNEISDVGILDILNTLKKPIILRALFLWGNKISHPSLATLKRMLDNGTIEQDHVDIQIYEVDKIFHAAWNSSSNKYAHRLYSVSDYGHTPTRKIIKNPSKPKKRPWICFKHHVGDADLGLPLYLCKENPGQYKTGDKYT